MFLQILFFVAILALLGILVKQAREQRLVVVALAILVTILPLNESFTGWSLLLASVLIVATFVFSKSRQFTWKPMYYAIVAMYVLGFWGLLRLDYLALANRTVDTTLPMIIFPILFSMVQLSKRNVVLLLRFFVWFVIVVCVYGLLSYATTVYGFSWKVALLDGKQFSRFFMVFPLTWQPSALSIMLLMALPVAFYLRYHDGRQITLVEMLLATILPILVLLMVGARVGVAVFPILLGLGYLFYCKLKPTVKWGLVGVAIAGLAVLLYLLPYDIRERFTDQLRIDQRTIAISAIKEKPILGWGIGQQRNLMACEARIQNLGIKNPPVFHHFHNLYLDIMVKFGIVGILVLSWLIFGLLGIAIRKKHFLLLSFIAMYAIVFYFEIVLYSPRWVVVFMFWFCFLIANQEHLISLRSNCSK